MSKGPDRYADRTESDQFEELTDQDDSIIGKVFGWSLALIALVGLVIAAWFGVNHWMTPEAVPIIEAEAPDLDSLLIADEGPEPPTAGWVDITGSAGIGFSHVNGAFGERLLPETMGGGVAFFDYNNDGHPDLLFVNSDHWEFGAIVEAPRPNALRLYQNDGQGQFTEVTLEAGLGGVHFYGMGVAVGDVDGDGWVDLYATAVGKNRLFMNEQGRFVESTDAAGVDGDESDWSTSAAFFDADNDGYLDLLVTNYVQWSREIDIEVDYRLTGLGRAYGPPTNFAGTHNRFYINNGDGTFRDQTEAAGFMLTHATTGEPIGKGLALMPIDFDGDGFMDVMIANDTVRNFVFHNQGDGTFVEVATEWGLGFDRNGLATGAMGIDAAYFGNDDRLGIAIGNFANEMSSFYQSQNRPTQFADQAILEGIGGATRMALTFGVLFVDYDNDGRLDYLQANGHVENNINQVQSSQQYRQSGQLFWNCGRDCSQTFRLLPNDRIGDLAQPIVGRGASMADIDGDGRMDVVLTQIGGPPLVLKNETATDHNWIRIQLTGKAPNTGAIGARVILSADGQSQQRLVMPTRSYLSQVELPVTFGLGQADQIEQLTIVWPDGSEQIVEALPINQTHRIQQSDQ